MLSRCFLDFSVGVRASVIGLSQISSFSLEKKKTLVVLLSIASNYICMLRPFSPLNLSYFQTLNFEHPSVLLFCFFFFK